MHLLVSVRSAAEVVEALAGEADIIDAKEPRHGALGSVSPAILAGISAAVPTGCPLSIALGDLSTRAEVESTISSLELSTRAGPVYLKMGFAGVAAASSVEDLLCAAVSISSRHRSAPQIIAAAYADARHAGSLSPQVILTAAVQAGCAGVLLDTCQKTGGDLFKWIGVSELARWIAEGRRHRLLTAVAGSLGEPQIGWVVSSAPDIIGVRGAACAGGRDGRVERRRVAALRRALTAASGFVQDPSFAANSGSRKALTQGDFSPRPNP
jgi:(5-formylfuran-3-yl)methyl phosphate synthase